MWAPVAGTVALELDSQAGVPLRSEGDGFWSVLVPDARPGTRYRFVVDGHAYPDPYSRSQPDGVHGPSQVVDPRAYAWHDDAWAGLSIEGLVVYQLHVGTVTPGGTFDSLIAELPRLKHLGVDAIEPLPVAEFPGERNWGYDGVDLFAVSRAYGGSEALKRFVDAAHAIGLGVLLDVVYNHFGPDGNYLRAYSPEYFTSRYTTPWGDAINYDGPGSEHVRQLVVDNARMWLDEYHVDGFRFDATHAIFDASRPHILAELSATLHAATSRRIVLIAETHENDVRYLEPVERGGFGLDAVWADEFHHVLRRFLAGDHEGYYSRFEGTLDELARCITSGWLHGAPTMGYPAWQFVYVLQNHDQVGNRAFGDRLHHQVDIDRYRAASALLLCLPQTPMLFMGQEFAATTPFQYFTDHTPELGRLVTEGRRREFQAFSAFADPATRERIPDPQARSTFERSKLVEAERERSPGQAVEALYRALLHLRRTDPVLSWQDRASMEVRAVSESVLTVRRWRGHDERLLIVNFGETHFGLADDPLGSGWRPLLATSPDVSERAVPARSATLLARGGA